MLNFGQIIGKFVKNSSQRELDRLRSIVKKINDYEPKIKEVPDESFKNKTSELRSKIKSGTIIENLNKPNISIIYISKNEEKITTIKPKKTAAIPSKLEYRIKEFKSYCLNQEKNNRSVYFQDLFKYFPECEKYDEDW